MAVIQKIGRLCLDFLVMMMMIVMLPGVPPNTTFSPYTLEPMRLLEGPLNPNTILDDAERVFEDRVNGPESIAVVGDNDIIVSLHGGKLMRIWGQRFDHFKIITSIGPGCAGPWEEELCGRPLGLRITADGKLLVADAYLGIFSVDIETGDKELIVDSKVSINGSLPLLVDDLDVDDDGNIYYSDASTICTLSTGILEMLSDPTGRLLKYDPKTKTSTVLVPKLHFANGVQLSPKKDFVLVSETFKFRVIRYWISGPNAGSNEVFIDRLPGTPDNIRARPGGGYYVSLVSVKDPTHTDMVAVGGGYPLLRKLFARLFTLTHMLFKFITKMIPNPYTAQMSFKILNLGTILDLGLSASNRTIIVEVDEDGEIIGSLQGYGGTLTTISETQHSGDYLYFGSPYNMYLGRLYVGNDTPIISVETGQDEDTSKTNKASDEKSPKTSKKIFEQETVFATQEEDDNGDKVIPKIKFEL